MVGLIECLSCYSLLQSPNRIDEMVRHAKEEGYDAIALTDINVLYGVIEFEKACRRYDIKPLYGMLLEYESDWQNRTHHLLVIAKNQAGYEALLRISTLRMSEEVHQLEDFKDEFHDLFIVTPGKEGELEQAILMRDYDHAKELIGQWQTLFSKCDFYMGLPYLQSDDEFRAFQMFSDMMNLPMIALSKVTYLTPDNLAERDVLRAIAEDRAFNPHVEDDGESMPVLSEFEHYFQQRNASALHHLDQFIQSCHVDIQYHQSLLPHYPVPAGEDAQSYLMKLCQKGKVRVENWNEEYESRLQHELKTIHDMGFDDYFLVVWDVMQAAHDRHILTAPGRGSAAGSLVSYLLFITDIDPLKYGLLFERFLNPHRQTMPDIDLDFPDNHRDELYQYVAEKYGQPYVARIITFGTLAAKQVVRDVARTFGASIPEQSEWARAVYIKQHDVKVTLKQAYEDSYALRRLVNESERNQTIFRMACRLEGLPRNTGVHAAGVVISTRRLDQYTPLQSGDSELYVTQWPMGAVEEIGLLKMDFLSLRNLKIVDDTLRGVKFQKGIDIDIKQISLNDDSVFEAFSQANTTGIFQFESRGMRQLLQKVKPKNIEDLALVNAIHRPGPNLDPNEVMQRREGVKPISYLDPVLEPILKPTYGLMVYQEQVMQVAQAFAGYTLAEADILRRAISKKNADILEQERIPFIERAVQQGHSEQVAHTIFDQIAMFAGYGFNKSHAIAYSILAYQMMYLKVNEPQAFYMALLRSVATRSQNFTDYVRSMAQQHIYLLPPDINRSFSDYTLTKEGQIQMGLSTIKGVDIPAVNEILNERKSGGEFTSFDDFLRRIPSELRKERLLQALIEAGTFDSIEDNRRELIEQLDGRLKNAEFINGNALLGSIFHLKDETIEDYTPLEKLALEKERLGTYISRHPLDTYEKLQQQLKIATMEEQLGNRNIRALVFVTHISEFKTKRNEPMAKLDIEGKWKSLTATLFPEQWIHYQNQIHDSEVYLIYGTYQNSKYGEQIIVDHLVPASQLEATLNGKHLYLLVPNDQVLKRKLAYLLQKSPGEIPVITVNEETREKRLLDERYWINPNSDAYRQIATLIGENRMAIQ